MTTPSASRPLGRRPFLLAAGAVGTAALAGCVSVGVGPVETSTSTERYAVSAGRSFAVRNRNGDVRVRPGDGDAVGVEISKEVRGSRSQLDDARVVRVDDGEVVAVETRHTGADALTGRVNVRLDVTVPAGVEVVEARTTNGDVVVTGVAGDAACETTNGDVEASGVDGFLSLRSANGDVRARNVTGIDGARTLNGTLDVEVRALRADTELRSVNGDVRVAFAPGVSASIDAATTNGDVSVTGLALADVERSRSRLSGRLGDGTYVVTIRSTNGDVTLEAPTG